VVDQKHKTVVISGASAGIGLATAEVFAAAGWRLALGARRTDRLEVARAALLKLGAAEVFCSALDVTDSASVSAFASAVQGRFGAIDVLVNNAGLALGVDRLATVSERDWTQVLETNVSGVLRMIRSFLPTMIESGRGHVINMGSIAGKVVYEGGSVYCASKHAVRAITSTLRLEVHGTGIRVTSIDPGMVETEFSEVRFGDREKARSVYKGMTPLTARDIAECVHFAANRPPHVNIEDITLMPVDQSAVHKVHRRDS